MVRNFVLLLINGFLENHCLLFNKGIEDSDNEDNNNEKKKEEKEKERKEEKKAKMKILVKKKKKGKGKKKAKRKKQEKIKNNSHDISKPFDSVFLEKSKSIIRIIGFHRY